MNKKIILVLYCLILISSCNNTNREIVEALFLTNDFKIEDSYTYENFAGISGEGFIFKKIVLKNNYCFKKYNTILDSNLVHGKWKKTKWFNLPFDSKHSNVFQTSISWLPISNKADREIRHLEKLVKQEEGYYFYYYTTVDEDNDDKSSQNPDNIVLIIVLKNIKTVYYIEEISY